MAETEKKVINWTDDQKLAIHARRENLIVSAAAGSGKTAALTERIFLLLTDENDPIPLSEIVAITFTRAAARNLKEKLSERIARAQAEDPKNTRLYHLQMQLPYANISTVHSFCLKIIRENATLLGLPERLTLGEEAALDALEKECMVEALHAFHTPKAGESAEEVHARLTLSKHFSMGRGPVTEAPLALYHQLRASAEGIDKLRDLLSEAEQNLADMQSGKLPLLHSAMGKLIRTQILFSLNQMKGKLEGYFSSFPTDEQTDNKILPAALLMKETLQKVTAVCSDEATDYDTIQKTLRNAEFAKRYANNSKTVESKSPEGEALKKLYAKIKKEFDALLLQHATDTATILQQERRRLFAGRQMFFLLSQFETLYSAKKIQRGILDYSDLEHYGYKALEQSDVSYCRALFVDEYQDTNRLQDDFFRKCVGKDGFFFFVGDVKQSIYLFRNAAPELFLGYKNQFPRYEENGTSDPNALGHSIFFSKNFRSDETILNFANDVFSVVMNDHTEQDLRMYAKEDELQFPVGKDQGKNLPVDYYLVDYEKEELPERRDEYTLVVDQIWRLIHEENRRPEEIAVIAYSNKTLSTLRALLIQCGIPVAPGSPELLNRPEVLHFCALLSAIANPFDDISLAALCRSPIFALSSEELLEIREKNSGAFYSALMTAGNRAFLDPVAERAREILDFLDLWQEFARNHAPSVTLLRLLRSTGILEALSGTDLRKRENLLHLYQLARAFENGQEKTLAEFLDFLNAGRAQEHPSASDPQVREGYVTLMTVHKSKGLEFPVCIYMSLSKRAPSENSIFFDLKHGLFLRDYSKSQNMLVSTVPYNATKRLRVQERLEEEKRLLYVGITRAIEKLILIDVLKRNRGNASSLFASTGIYPKLSDSAIHSHELSCPDQLLLYGLRDDDTLTAFAAQEIYTTEPDGLDCRNFRLHFLPGSELPPLPTPINAEATGEIEPRFLPEQEAELTHALDLEEARRHATRAPAKLSVSEILHLGEAPENGKTHLSFSSDDRLGARHGTAMHAFMQFCDFTAAKSSPEAEATRLADRAFLTKEQAEGLNFLALSRFFSSATFAELEKSPRVKRELRFNVFLSAKDVLPEGDGKVLIQGVIDCFYEKEDGTYAILDFKTDAVNPKDGEAILRDRHAKQLQLYALALRELTGKAVTKLALYSFSLAREISIPLN